MELNKFLQAKKIQQKILELKNLRDKVSKNKFYIEINLDKIESESAQELRESFMPMLDDEFNRVFFNNINKKIQDLDLEFKNL